MLDNSIPTIMNTIPVQSQLSTYCLLNECGESKSSEFFAFQHKFTTHCSIFLEHICVKH